MVVASKESSVPALEHTHRDALVPIHPRFQGVTRVITQSVPDHGKMSSTSPVDPVFASLVVPVAQDTRQECKGMDERRAREERNRYSTERERRRWRWRWCSWFVPFLVSSVVALFFFWHMSHGERLSRQRAPDSEPLEVVMMEQRWWWWCSASSSRVRGIERETWFERLPPNSYSIVR